MRISEMKQHVGRHFAGLYRCWRICNGDTATGLLFQLNDATGMHSTNATTAGKQHGITDRDGGVVDWRLGTGCLSQRADTGPFLCCSGNEQRAELGLAPCLDSKTGTTGL